MYLWDKSMCKELTPVWSNSSPTWTLPLWCVRSSGSISGIPGWSLRVLEAMFSGEGQRKTSAGSAALSCNKNVSIELHEVFAQVEDRVRRNHLYIRLASAKTFSVSKSVVQKMICGEIRGAGRLRGFQRTAYRHDGFRRSSLARKLAAATPPVSTAVRRLQPL